MLLFPPSEGYEGTLHVYTCINQLKYKRGVQKSSFKTLTEKGENIYKPDYWEEISIMSPERKHPSGVFPLKEVKQSFTQTLQVVCSMTSTPVTHSSRTISFMPASASPVE